MKKIYQTDHSSKNGDCVRACIASIFEIDINSIPNFWLQTQDSFVFWEYLNEWMGEELNHKCIIVTVGEEKEMFFIKDLLCIAVGHISADSEEEHAVVWQNGMVHNPSGSKKGFYGRPKTFVVFSPFNPCLS